jgi:hypothetical protein
MRRWAPVTPLRRLVPIRPWPGCDVWFPFVGDGRLPFADEGCLSFVDEEWPRFIDGGSLPFVGEERFSFVAEKCLPIRGGRVAPVRK